MAMVIGLWPGFRFTTATFSHSEPRSILETADSDLTRNNDSRDKNIPNRNSIFFLKSIAYKYIFLKSNLREDFREERKVLDAVNQGGAATDRVLVIYTVSRLESVFDVESVKCPIRRSHVEKLARGEFLDA